MINKLARALFGSKNDRELKRLGKLVEKISSLESDYEVLADADLKGLTEKFRQRFEDGETLDSILPEAFAAVREASKRTLGLRHYDVQLIGGVVLHDGKIAEMRTGEGKTLVATLAAYLNAISGEGVHLITVNDYLARRDAHWMGPIYSFLGMKVGVIQSSGGLGADSASFLFDDAREGEIPGFKHLHPATRRESYAADITYGTNNEFGFDYLRDNMVLSLEQKSQRGLGFAIVDEVDSILIDEARTPLIISGKAEDSSKLYKQINTIVPSLERGETEESVEPGEEYDPKDFIIDEKMNQVELTEQGHQKIEEMMIANGLLEEGENLYSAKNLNLLHHVQTALKAHQLFQRDAEYIVQDGQIVLIDEHTGRKMLGRRLSEGLHQALEAKENLEVQSESQTLASTTFQNFFRLYQKLSGMTGTADTEAVEFNEIYRLQVVVIPTNQPVNRNDLNDLIYMSQEEKYEAVIDDIEACREKGAPVLVGTITIEASEYVSSLLKQRDIPHQVLNAKFHEKEAEIVAQAGMPGAVTIATNMAGRGTDIVLGGNLEMELAKLENASPEQIEKVRSDWKARNQTVIEAQGLHIIGTERHESRRIDNQLRGRAGRQGDPGVSRFYLSMEDNLMRLFASDRVRGIMQAIGLERGEAIEHKMVTNSIEKAQRKVEGRNFDIRKQLLEYDDVANDQRSVIYYQRNQLLEMDDISELIIEVREEVVADSVAQFMPPESVDEQWDVDGLISHLMIEFGFEFPIKRWLNEDNTMNDQGVIERVTRSIQTAYEKKVSSLPEDIVHRMERDIMLSIMDRQWKSHLSTMDALRAGIGLRGYAGKNPKQEYKRESFNLFQDMLVQVKYETIKILTRLELASAEEFAEMERLREEREKKLKESMMLRHDQLAVSFGGEGRSSAEGEEAEDVEKTPFVREQPKVGRNQPCPCGSGKKYKQCHGKLS